MVRAGSERTGSTEPPIAIGSAVRDSVSHTTIGSAPIPQSVQWRSTWSSPRIQPSEVTVPICGCSKCVNSAS